MHHILIYLQKPFLGGFQETLLYEAIGDGSALSYFMINQNGQVFVKQNLYSEVQTVYQVGILSHLLIF